MGFQPTMGVEEAIRTRRTHKVYRSEPVPRDQLDDLFELARWAPNHHLTNPWRFRVIGPRALQALKEADPAGAAKLDRAPTLIACSVVQTDDPAQNEEDVAAGACAVYIVMLAAHARGIASYWRTPAVLRSPAGRAAAGIAADEHVLGLLHLGYADREWQAPGREPPARFVTYLD
ncbi:MAG TPA: nitroreductase [Gaiellales bacterium]|nr:nitroreductase [Gaiellales bacterium]